MKMHEIAHDKTVSHSFENRRISEGAARMRVLIRRQERCIDRGVACRRHKHDAAETPRDYTAVCLSQ
eukprot:5696711-Pleurochrysis_carterae.AAC.2